ncbi:hypothetical protein [Anabaena azotica]|uniref:Uncharacterized protein n=1 Tax=Anabaena azotica FACHB-119 TaxID=947527 RepID=A0ABR8DDJ9_9NOST|nr:hypothetical protein [Anabaena azotica]MBD2504440.1 hypothetical protein [Anabaena azotica FACHB-119]
MATKEEVKRYLAYWFQLGKKVVIGSEETRLLPQPVFQGDRYSQAFEDCWQRILSSSGDSYLDGTEETIAELLTPAWDMVDCSRCSMPVPLRNMGMPPVSCPCVNLPGWPNTELPGPRCPINNQEQLMAIRNRLVGNLTAVKQ